MPLTQPFKRNNKSHRVPLAPFSTFSASYTYLTIILLNLEEYRLILADEAVRGRTKLHIPPDICYLRMTDIESIMTIFG